MVYSFDSDPRAAAYTVTIRRRYFPNDSGWIVEKGSILDTGYLSELDDFDAVYSLGMLHDTGNMRLALENTLTEVRPGGKLFVAIYNDQGRKSLWWTKIKRCYNKMPLILKPLYVVTFMFPFVLLHNLPVLHRLPRAVKDYKKERGMSLWCDWVDWGCNEFVFQRLASRK